MRREFALSSAGLAAAFDFIAETVARGGRDNGVAHRLSVIVDEIFGNLVKHDGSLTDAHCITLELTDDGAGTVLVICDPGRPFNPLVHRAGAPDIGGYGLDLVRGLSSSVSYVRAEGCNRLTVSIAAEHEPPEQEIACRYSGRIG
jgi:anti-sigma regulatory factor (Ser/Thr protein kinase)